MSRRAELEEVARRIGERIGGALPDGTGFCLMIFEMDDDVDKRGHMTYVSNADRPDMVRAARELIDVVAEGRDLPPKVQSQ